MNTIEELLSNGFTLHKSNHPHGASVWVTNGDTPSYHVRLNNYGHPPYFHIASSFEEALKIVGDHVDEVSITAGDW